MSSKNIRIRVAAVIFKNGKLLLVRHEKPDPASNDIMTYWLLPGGGVEFGEPLGEALEREILEETGLKIKTGKILFISDTIPHDKHRHILHIMFEAHVTGGKLETRPQDRLVEAKFHSLAELGTLTIYPPIGNLLKKLKPEDLSRADEIYLGNLWNKPFINRLSS